ncbi:hypothetical protein [Sulfurimonas sp. HSL3-7]|uniref:hypothetical protein n=1 Tax=Sulfonitrofixus jiaomeiensis TaxID=3131938 RepID=UPI0031FA3DF4
MDAKLRTQKIQELMDRKKDNPYSSKEIRYMDKVQKLPVFEIPVELLIFNQYNGRIGTFVKTYEKQHGPIDATTKKGEKLIVDFLWNSKVNRNKETKKNIIENGQLEFGIVTKDGVVIDGNRRCMLLKKIAEETKSTPTYFKAIVLDETLQSNPKEIRKLETMYQMGVDEKVDYNAIEQYLKCSELSQDFSNEEIAKMMGKKPSDIKNYLEILALMEEYLEAYGYGGMYTRLNEETVEGPFVDLRGYLETQTTGKGIRGRDWQPEKDDIDDLKNIYFDYIRAGFRTAHNIRDIGNPAKGQGFFSHEKVWREFVKRYDERIDPINDQEKSLEELRSERPGEEIEDIIRGRDSDWKSKVEPSMKENIGRTKRDLDDQKEANSPMELLERARRTLQSVNTDIDAFRGKEIREISHEIRKLAEGFIKIVDIRD